LERNEPVGVDAANGTAHSAETTAANVADTDKAAELLREDSQVMYGDNGYQGIERRPDTQGNGQLPGTGCRINRKKGADRKREKEICGDALKHLEYRGELKRDRIEEGLKSKVRSKAEHMLGIIKGIYEFRKVRGRGLKKNLGEVADAVCERSLC
jgi:IS5 family transposase